MTRLMVALALVVIAGVACSTEQATPPGSADDQTPRPPSAAAVGHEPNLVAGDRFEPASDGPCRARLGEPAAAETVLVFFTCGQRVEAAPRALPPGSDEARYALDAFFAGPNEAEREAGYDSVFSQATSGLPYTFELRGDVGVVNLSGAFFEVEFLFVPVRTFAELVSTVGALDGVRRVAVLVDGEPLCVVLEEC